jgi:hypothetical protein
MTRHPADEFLPRALVVPPDLRAGQARSLARLAIVAAVFAALMAGVWIGQSITQTNHDRMEAVQ